MFQRHRQSHRHKQKHGLAATQLKRNITSSSKSSKRSFLLNPQCILVCSMIIAGVMITVGIFVIPTPNDDTTTTTTTTTTSDNNHHLKEAPHLIRKKDAHISVFNRNLNDPNVNDRNPPSSSKEQSLNNDKSTLNNKPAPPVTPPTGQSSSYQHWRDIATKLAKLPKQTALSQLLSIDPFSMRKLENDIYLHESSLQRHLTTSEITTLFPCPSPTHRLSLPDQRDATKAHAFRQNDPPNQTFLFFQHLRKAGGTNFCTLAERNLPRSVLPSYYCMPDYDKDWSGRTTAGYLHKYSNEEIVRRMRSKGYRIAGNEWQNMRLDSDNNNGGPEESHFNLPAIFATSFRRPLDRALSQFRFECIEERGCVIKDVTKWWEHRTDLKNVYTWTFADVKHYPLNRAAVAEDGEERARLLGVAMDTVAKYHLVLVMEWLAYAEEEVRDVLGFERVDVLRRRVRPHIGQAKRDDGQEENKLGSAGIEKASWDPKEYLSEELYKVMSEDLVLDEILTDVARRLFMERLVCR